jgi:uncharacterized RDD family membrane protein YckC
MSSAAHAVSASIPVKREIIVDFDPVKLRAPFFLRCGAVIIDYLIVVMFPVLGLLLGRLFGEDGARLLSSEINNIAWLVAILIGFSNVVLLPMVTGQSIGKMIVGLKIVRISGERASIGTIAFRQIFGYLITLASAGLGFFFSVFSSKGRALHDYLSGTVVVYAHSRIRS